jgi:ribosomal protein S27E
MAKKKSSSTPRGFKKLKCKFCDNVSDRVDNNATAITCWQCTQKLVNGEHLEVSK